MKSYHQNQINCASHSRHTVTQAETQSHTKGCVIVTHSHTNKFINTQSQSRTHNHAHTVKHTHSPTQPHTHTQLHTYVPVMHTAKKSYTNIQTHTHIDCGTKDRAQMLPQPRST